MTVSPGFELIRKYKTCEEHTEKLVLKKARGRVSQDELITIFEKGIAGEYGKFIYADPQTLLGWIEKFVNQKNNSKNYLETGLLSVNTHITSHNYPVQPEDWHKEANRCYTAYLNGVSETNFHPHVYDRMLLDGFIVMNAYLKHFSPTGSESGDIMLAKQKILKDIFAMHKKQGKNFIYFIAPSSK